MADPLIDRLQTKKASIFSDFSTWWYHPQNVLATFWSRFFPQVLYLFHCSSQSYSAPYRSHPSTTLIVSCSSSLFCWAFEPIFSHVNTSMKAFSSTLPSSIFLNWHLAWWWWLLVTLRLDDLDKFCVNSFQFSLHFFVRYKLTASSPHSRLLNRSNHALQSRNNTCFCNWL